jgi:UDP-4-amino-4,6-dideoxy-N-acetyl-beta-L-altrosamine transaminase
VTRKVIPYGQQWIDADDIAAVAAVFDTGWLTQGPAIERFETALSERVEAEFAIAFANGTAALHGACFAAGLGPDDLLVTSPLTFMASANCGRYVGAKIALADIDRSTLNIDLNNVPETATAVVPVHFAGLPVDLSGFRREGAVIIEDGAHALGASTPNGPVGNCALSDMTEFSFHPVKAITSGEGGAITTNDPELAARLRKFRSHCIVPNPENGAWSYEISEVGFNYRMTDLQAALGIAQLRKLDDFIDRRNLLANRYREKLRDTETILPPEAPDGFTHAYHIFPIQVRDRRRIFDRLREAGIGVQVHYVPVHHHPVSSDIGLKPGDLPECDAVYEGLISLPMFPKLSVEDQDYVIETLKRLLG